MTQALSGLSFPSFSSTIHFYTPAIISFLSNKYDYTTIPLFFFFLHFFLISHWLSYKGQVLLSGYSASWCNPNIHFQFYFLPLSTAILNSKPQWTSHISLQNAMHLHILFSLPEMPFLPLLYIASPHSVFKALQGLPFLSSSRYHSTYFCVFDLLLHMFTSSTRLNSLRVRIIHFIF